MQTKSIVCLDLRWFDSLVTAIYVLSFATVFLYRHTWTYYANSKFNDTMILCSYSEKKEKKQKHKIVCGADPASCVFHSLIAFDFFHSAQCCALLLFPICYHTPINTIKFNYFSITFIKLDLFIYLLVAFFFRCLPFISIVDRVYRLFDRYSNSIQW